MSYTQLLVEISNTQYTPHELAEIVRKAMIEHWPPDDSAGDCSPEFCESDRH